MQLRESFDKLNQILQQEPPRRKKMFIIKAQNRTFEVEVNDQMTPYDLLQLVKSHPQLPNPQNVISLKSSCGSATLDYVLSLRQQESVITLQQLNNRESLIAVYNHQRPCEKLCLRDFTFERCIGKGGTSDVFMVRHNLSGRLFALKMIKKQYVSDCRRLEQILRERKILSEILNNSSFIIPLHATFASQDYLSFLMEFSPGGEMFYHLQNYRFDEDQVKLYFCEVLSALEELHNNQVLYRDLKPENILIDIKGHINLTDFGLSKLGLQDEQLTYSFCGSPEYMPPEIISREGYSYGADFYTLGCLLYELLVGLPPHYSQDTQEIFNNIQHQEITYPDNLPKEIIDLLKMLLNKQPNQRVQSCATIKRTKWLKNIDWDAVRKKQLKAPIQISLYESNIHDEFLQVDVSELNRRNQQGLLESNEDLFSFFDYVNPHSQYLFQPSIQKSRVLSDTHLMQKKKKKKPSLIINEPVVEKEKEKENSKLIKSSFLETLSRVQTGSNRPGGTLTPSHHSTQSLVPLQLLRQSFQSMLVKQRLDDSQKSKSRDKSRQTLMSERGFEKSKIGLESLLQSPVATSSTKVKHQQSFPSQLYEEAAKNFSGIKQKQKTQFFKKHTPTNSMGKNPLTLNLDVIQQHYNNHFKSKKHHNL